MSTDHAASVSGLALRVSSLDVSGTPVVSATGAYVTSSFMSLGFTPEYTEGDEVEEKAADGTVCVYYQLPDVLKRVSLTLAICAPDPELQAILVGGTILSSLGVAKTISNKALTTNVATLTTSTVHGFTVGQTVVVAGVGSPFDGTYVILGTPTTTTFTYSKTNADVTSAVATGTATISTVSGWAAPPLGQEGTPNGIAIEVWSRAIVAGKMASVNPYWRWVFPYAKLRMSGDRVLENGMMANTFEGWGVGNPSFGDGPNNDWLFASDRAYQYARDTTFPTQNGYVTVLP